MELCQYVRHAKKLGTTAAVNPAPVNGYELNNSSTNRLTLISRPAIVRIVPAKPWTRIAGRINSCSPYSRRQNLGSIPLSLPGIPKYQVSGVRFQVSGLVQ